ncbi:DUF1700 domain-containing protein [Romboutsia weinsteinii]|uniref:DUF1700 domain-containing protein n=1 Tax=Romboutsia weinsteinii TaxID=2020949 RepID=UPI001313F8D2|nr:DUF1700 domain-containing protein [Romboutsia weinsteinii]
MNKAEFLEILRDYLKKDLSENEVNDILRDYEEYFVDGLIEGKNDMEIISALGSPKSISRDIISQIKDNDGVSTSTKDSIEDKIQKGKIKVKEQYKKSKDYISEKLTPDLEGKGNGFSSGFIKIVLTILTILIIIPAFSFAMAILGVGIALVGTLIGFLVSVPFIISIIWSVPQLASLLIFASIGFIGGQILAWQIYILIIKLAKSLVQNYINWIKTRNIYINASKKQDELKKGIFDEEGDDIDE